MSFGRPRDKDIVRVRRETFSGSREDYLYLVQAWGQAAVDRMRRGDDGAHFDAELACRFARKGGLIEAEDHDGPKL